MTVPSFPNLDRLQVGACLAVSTYFLFGASLTTAVPAISDDLSMPFAPASMALAALALVAGVLVVAAGAIGDRIGRVQTVHIGLGASIAGSLLGATATGPAMLLGGRALQGLSGALVVPATLALLNARSNRRALGRWSTTAWGCVAVSAVVGGALTTSIGWRWIFGLSIPVAAVALLLLGDVPESRARKVDERFDSLGLGLLAAGVVALSVTITYGAMWGWTSRATSGGFCLAAVALTTFFVYERRQHTPLLRYSLFHRRAFDGAIVQNFLLNYAGAAGIFVFTLYVQQDRGLSAFRAGLLTLTFAAGALGAMRLGRRLGARLPMIAGGVLTAAGLVLVARTGMQGSGYYISAALGFLVVGIGMGGSATPTTDTAVGAASTTQAGAAAGVYRMASSLGAGFGIAVPSAVFSSVLAADPGATGRAATWAIATGCAAAAVGALAVVRWVPSGRMARPAGKRKHLHVGHSHGRIGAAV